MNKLRLALSLCLIFVIVFATFLPFLKNGFVNWDDDRYVTENTIIRSLSLNNIKDIFTSFYLGHYHPITMLSYLFEYQLFKLNPFGYHLNNLILHLLNCLLVFWLIFILTGSISISLLTAILFGIHPLQVESVAWISERKNVLYAFFFLGAVISYLCYFRRGRKLKYYFLCLSLFILSLLSKSMAVTLPLVLFLMDYLFRRKADKTMFVEKIPFFVLSLIFGIIAIFGVHSSGAIRQESTCSLLSILIVASYGIVFYLSRIFLPFKLSCLYPYYGTGNIFFLYSMITVVILTIGVIISARHTRKVIFGSALFLCALLPALQFIPNGEIIVADRYGYIASIGIFYILAEAIFWLFSSKIKHNRFKQAILLIALILIAGVLVSVTWKRCRVWRDSLSLWSDVLNKYPNVATAYNSRGAEYLAKKEYAKAYADFMSALSIDQNYYEAYFNLGSLYSSKGDYNEAVKLINKTLQINPGYLKAYDMLATIYGLTGKHSEVISICKKVIQIKHDYVQAYINLCSAYGNLGNFQEAIAYGEKAIAINPISALAHMNLSAAYFYTKKYNLAIKHCDRAVALGYKVCPKFLEELKIYRK